MLNNTTENDIKNDITNKLDDFDFIKNIITKQFIINFVYGLHLIYLKMHFIIINMVLKMWL